MVRLDLGDALVVFTCLSALHTQCFMCYITVNNIIMVLGGPKGNLEHDFIVSCLECISRLLAMVNNA